MKYLLLMLLCFPLCMNAQGKRLAFGDYEAATMWTAPVTVFNTGLTNTEKSEPGYAFDIGAAFCNKETFTNVNLGFTSYYSGEELKPYSNFQFAFGKRFNPGLGVGLNGNLFAEFTETRMKVGFGGGVTAIYTTRPLHTPNIKGIVIAHVMGNSLLDGIGFKIGAGIAFTFLQN